MILNFKVIFEDASDTLFRAMNDVNNQTFTWTFTKKPVLFYFDHDNEIVLKQATTILGIPEPLSQEGFHLYQNIPNPVTNSTKIVYELNKDCAVQMNIRDISGKTVSSPVNEFASQGKHSVDVDCSSFAPGVYFYTVQAGDFTQTKRMVITK